MKAIHNLVVCWLLVGVLFSKSKDTINESNSKIVLSLSHLIKNIMKSAKIFLLLFVASVVFNGCGPAKQYVKIDRMPEFPGGLEKLTEYLTQNIHYPEAAMQAGVQGRVVVSFIIEPDGSISDCHVSQSLSPSCDAEALRVVKAMPRWNPGMDKGEPIRMMFNLPISFKFSNNEDY